MYRKISFVFIALLFNSYVFAQESLGNGSYESNDIGRFSFNLFNRDIEVYSSFSLNYMHLILKNESVNTELLYDPSAGRTFNAGDYKWSDNTNIGSMGMGVKAGIDVSSFRIALGMNYSSDIYGDTSATILEYFLESYYIFNHYTDDPFKFYAGGELGNTDINYSGDYRDYFDDTSSIFLGLAVGALYELNNHLELDVKFRTAFSLSGEENGSYQNENGVNFATTSDYKNSFALFVSLNYFF